MPPIVIKVHFFSKSHGQGDVRALNPVQSLPSTLVLGEEQGQPPHSTLIFNDSEPSPCYLRAQIFMTTLSLREMVVIKLQREIGIMMGSWSAGAEGR